MSSKTRADVKTVARENVNSVGSNVTTTPEYRPAVTVTREPLQDGGGAIHSNTMIDGQFY